MSNDENLDLVSSAEAAKMVGYKIDHFRSVIKLSKGFPKPVQHELPNGGLSRPKWKKSDIEEYMRKRTEKKAA